MRKSKLLIAAPILSAVLLLAGCGSDSEDTDSGSATAAATEEATEEATEDAAEVNTDKADAIVAAATAQVRWRSGFGNPWRGFTLRVGMSWLC